MPDFSYIDYERLSALNPDEYQRTQPYPWVNPTRLLTSEGYQALLESLPDVSMFRQSFGEPRRHGQKPHDRFVLAYEDVPELAKPWHEFIDELCGRRYRRYVSRLVGKRALEFRFRWHYASAGCSVSPHCDTPPKIGSHIFYFNTTHDWDSSWGGDTLILDDGGKFHPHSNPEFDDFDHTIPCHCIGNRSLLFTRNASSWHGVRKIECPEGYLRKIFVVVINRREPLKRLRSWARRRFMSLPIPLLPLRLRQKPP